MGIGVWLGLGRSEGAESIRISRFIGLERPCSDDGRSGSIFPRPSGTGTSPKRFRAEERTRSPFPFSQPVFLDRLLLSFPVVADRSGSFLETVFWFSSIGLPSVPVVAGDGWPLGEGLGGGYRTPPNRTRRERSELVCGGSGGYFDPPFYCIAT